MDPTFLTELRTLAALAADALEGRASLARDADSYQAAEVADVAANAFRALATLASKCLDGERARLEEAVTQAEARCDEADADFGTWDRAAAMAHDRHYLTPDDRARIVARMQSAEGELEEAHRALDAARKALAAFDAATKGGE